MKKFFTQIFFGFVVAAAGIAAAQGFDPAAEPVRAALHTRLASPAGTALRADVAPRDVKAQMALFYAGQQYRPVWTEGGKVSPRVDALLKALQEATREGLSPADYPVGRIAAQAAILRNAEAAREARTPEALADFDLFLTEAFLTYGADLALGRFDPERSFFQWIPYHRPFDGPAVLTKVVAGAEPGTALRDIGSRHPSYLLLRERLSAYRLVAAAGGWPDIPKKGRPLKLGDRGETVAALKKHLELTGDLHPALSADPLVFDKTCEAALRHYQWRHGLIYHGRLDAETRAAMSVPVEQRIRQIEMNLERWRWLPDDFGPEYLMLIIPDFQLFVVDAAKTVLSMRVVVGRPKQPTPVFNDVISYVEMNPTWSIPQSIVAAEMFPKILKDPEFLTKKSIRIYRDWSDNSKQVDPKTISWDKMNPEKFPYRMVQDPGVNPLGKIKFMFPNEFDVYLHDTTQRYLFARHRRMFSHGCMRVEKPYDLAEWVFKDKPDWPKKRVLKEIRKGKRLQVDTRPIPVHVVYLTAWVDGNGVLQFRNDWYGYDKNHETILQKRITKMENRS